MITINRFFIFQSDYAAIQPENIAYYAQIILYYVKFIRELAD